MPAVYIPEPLTAPGLWYPNRKPVVPVKINRRTPIARDLEFCVLSGQGNVDIVKGLAPKVVGPSYQERGGDFYASNANTNGYLTYDKTRMPNVANGFSVMFHVLPDFDSADNGFYYRTFLDCSNNLGDGIRLFSTGTGGAPNRGMRFRLIANGVGVNCDADSPVIKGQELTFICTWDKSNMRLYRDGALLSTTSQANSLSSVSHLDWMIGMVWSFDNKESSATSHVKSTTVWRRALTPEEARSASRNPYQFLEAA